MNLNENLVGRGRGGRRPMNPRRQNVARINLTSMQQQADKKRTSAAPTAVESGCSSSTNIKWNHNSIFSSKQTSTSKTTSDLESKVVLALTEGRGGAECEVGMAAVSVSSPHLILCQTSDKHSYINTLTKINILNPTEILVPATFVKNFTTTRLIDKIKEKFRNIRIIPINRGTFNSVKGMEQLQKVCEPAFNSVFLVIQHKYYASSAAAALLTYIESTLNVYYAKNSIKVEYQQSEGFTLIDLLTADHLELVQSTSSTKNSRYSSLFSILNNCPTKVGQRCLRSLILQPPCSLREIEANLDCVTELLSNPELLTGIQSILVKLTNVDQLLSLSTVLPKKADDCSEQQLNYILLLNTLLCLMTPLEELLTNMHQSFFVDLRQMLKGESFVLIKNIIHEVIHTDSHVAKGYNGIMQRCFAIKTGVNRLLDYIRQSYSELVDKMREHVQNLAQEHNMRLTLGNNNKKGFHIVLTLSPQQKRYFKKSDLPAEFIEVCRLAGSVTMKTQELISLSNRSDDVMLEIIKISNMMIYDLLMEIHKYVPLFYELCEKIARLDLLQSLAQASMSNNYIRPKFGDFTELSHSRHPLLEFLLARIPVANSIVASDEYNVHIITGPNGSGKSIFIRQVVLLQIMAQIGCYVPAYSATFRIADKIFAKIYLEDNMDCGASAFVLEIKEIDYYLTSATKNSLIIIDELCRSTSVEDGTALAMAFCEEFIKKSCFVFFTTHYTAITKLQEMYYNVKTWQLETVMNANGSLDFKYNVIPGVVSLKRYGVSLMRSLWRDIIDNYVEEFLNENSENSEVAVVKIDPRMRMKYDLEAEIKMLKRKGKLTRAALNGLLNDYVSAFEKNFGVSLALNLFTDMSGCDQTDGEEIKMPNITGDVEALDVWQSQGTNNSFPNVDDFVMDDLNTDFLIPEILLGSTQNSDVCLTFNSNTPKSTQDSIRRQGDFKSAFVNNETPFACVNAQQIVPDEQILDVSNPFVDNLQNIQESIHRQDDFKSAFINDENPFVCMNSQQIVPDSQTLNISSPFMDNLQKRDLFDTTTTGELKNENDEISSIMEEIQNNSELFFDAEWDHDDVLLNTQSTTTNEKSHKGNIIETPGDFKENTEHPENVMMQSSSPSITYSPLCSLNSERSSNEKVEPCRSEKIRIIESYTFKPDAPQKSEEQKTEQQNQDAVIAENEKSVLNETTNKDDPPENQNVTTNTNTNPDGSSSANKSSSVQNDDETSSSIAWATTKKRRIKFKRPYEVDVTSSASTSGSNKSKNKRNVHTKFIPPKVLTKKQIQQEYYEQDKKMLNDNDPSKSEEYLSLIMNRPSVQQLQEMTHLALIRRTENGVVVIPPQQPKSRRATKEITPKGLQECSFDVSLFSDENARYFDTLMKSEEKTLPLHLIKSRSLTETEFPGNNNEGKKEVAFYSQDLTKYYLKIKEQSVLTKSDRDGDPTKVDVESGADGNFVTSNKDTSESYESVSTQEMPDCYYKQNRDVINSIMNKYLSRPEGGDANAK